MNETTHETKRSEKRCFVFAMMRRALASRAAHTTTMLQDPDDGRKKRAKNLVGTEGQTGLLATKYSRA
jgi:hypothetical protein